VNFFGHAAVARRRSEAAGFVLGSMVPDLAAMVRARPPASEHDELSAGIAFHHVTDEVFHDTPSFRRLSRDAFDDLVARGVGKNAARAVAHIGVEILLDGELVDGETERAYLAALGESQRLARHLAWAGPREESAFVSLAKALEGRGVSRDHSAPETLTFRVTRALAHRPRLALRLSDEPLVRDWAEAARPLVAQAAEGLLWELEAGLGAR
jgi:hypothetical protein